MYKPGFQIYALPFKKDIWQFAVFTIGQDIDMEWPEDHDSDGLITWYVQLLFWQFSYTRPL